MNITAIIQARMGSSRLPGKAMVDINGKPMLWHVVNRLTHCKNVNQIVVAATTEKDDDTIEDFCRKEKFDFFRGSENDVLDRYYKAAVQFKADVVVRITSDCPLIDPSVVDTVIEGYVINTGAFDASSNTVRRTYPRGLDAEVLPFKVLKEIWERAIEAAHREHVTKYIYDKKDIYKIYSAENKIDLSYLRLTVDEQADLELVREIYKMASPKNEIFTMKDILLVLKKNPSLQKINEHVRQKTV